MAEKREVEEKEVQEPSNYISLRSTTENSRAYQPDEICAFADNANSRETLSDLLYRRRTAGTATRDDSEVPNPTNDEQNLPGTSGISRHNSETATSSNAEAQPQDSLVLPDFFKIDLEDKKEDKKVQTFQFVAEKSDEEVGESPKKMMKFSLPEFDELIKGEKERVSEKSKELLKSFAVSKPPNRMEVNRHPKKGKGKGKGSKGQYPKN